MLTIVFRGTKVRQVSNVEPISRPDSRANDSTERVHLNPMVRNLSMLAELENLASLGTWEHDCDTSRELWSDNLCQLLGRKPSRRRIPGIEFWKLIHPQDRQKVHLIISQAMKEKTSYEYQARFLLPEGRERIFLNRGKIIVGAGNRVVKRIGISQDITERAALEKELSRSEERYRDLVENNSDLICTHNLAGELLSMNERPALLLGYRPEQLIGRRIQDVLPEEFRQDYEEYIARIQRRGQDSGLLAVRTRNGERRIWEYKNTFRTHSVLAPFVQGTARDITERFKAEKELKLQKENFRRLSNQLMHAQDEERRHISHELHETLAQDLAALQMLLRRVERSQATNSLSQAATEEALGLNREITQKVRTLAYLFQPPFLEPGDLGEAIRWYVHRFKEHSGIRTRVLMPSELGTLDTEVRTTLFRVLQECLLNIHRHSESPTLCVRVCLQHDSISMNISDRGKGMPIAALKKFPNNFGVGIVGMRERVHLLNGTFQVLSIPNKGVRISVQLPIAFHASTKEKTFASGNPLFKAVSNSVG